MLGSVLLVGMAAVLYGLGSFGKEGPASCPAAEAATGRRAELSTSGGTSDARFIRALCPVAELGLVGTTMHMVDDRAPVAELHALTHVYEGVLRRYFETFGAA